MVAKVLGEKALTGFSATKDEVKIRLQEGVSIIHIATELILSPGPRVGKKIPKENIYSSGIDAQLVVLSCCHSGRGTVKAEGVVGLTRAARARSVLASLWAVDDKATYYFMESFYWHLKSGESASASLQQAMKKMRTIPKWSHPYYWASFFIVGDDIRITTVIAHWSPCCSPCLWRTDSATGTWTGSSCWWCIAQPARRVTESLSRARATWVWRKP